MYLKFRKLHPDAKLPVKAHDDDSCFDIFALEDIELEALTPTLVRTGLAYEPSSPNYGVQIRGRSGNMLKRRLNVFHGTVDPGYRGEWGVVITYISAPGTHTTIQRGDKIAQFFVEEIAICSDIVEVNDLEESARGRRGYGSTGM